MGSSPTLNKYFTFTLLYCIINSVKSTNNNDETVRIFLSGDVMIGRGIDQILKFPSDPFLPNPKKTAKSYIKSAEKINGKLPPHTITSTNNYIWGDLIESFSNYAPDIKLINLETSITHSNDYWPNKSIHYRMNPQNIYTLNTLQTKHNNNLVCNLANNHILDWGYAGLNETLQTLSNNNISYCGAGLNTHNAWKPVIIELPSKHCRIFIFGSGTESASIPQQWTATNNRSGINMINTYNHSKVYIQNIMKQIKKHVLLYDEKYMKNIIILSIHWGKNWGFEINNYFIQFAHALIDYNDENNIGIDMIHGHSSHHIKAFEIYKNKVIFYGCGDFISDYEGLTGHSEFHKDLGFMYFVDLNVSNGNVHDVILKGTHVKHFSITYANNEYLMWLYDTMKTLCERFNVSLFELEHGIIHIGENNVLFEGHIGYSNTLMEVAARVAVTHLYWLTVLVFVTVNCLIYYCYFRIQKRSVNIEFHDYVHEKTVASLPYVD